MLTIPCVRKKIFYHLFLFMKTNLAYTNVSIIFKGVKNASNSLLVVQKGCCGIYCGPHHYCKDRGMQLAALLHFSSKLPFKFYHFSHLQ